MGKRSAIKRARNEEKRERRAHDGFELFHLLGAARAVEQYVVPVGGAEVLDALHREPERRGLLHQRAQVLLLPDGVERRALAVVRVFVRRGDDAAVSAAA